MTERFGPLLARHRPWLLRQAKRLTSGGPEADDLVQDVFIRFTLAFQDRALPEDRGAVAWLTTALKNAFISGLRKVKVQEKADADPTLPDAISPGGGSPESFQSDSVSEEDLARAVDKLSAKQRAVFEASAAGKRYAEIAGELEINVNAVAKRLFDARVRLRKLLKPKHRKDDE